MSRKLSINLTRKQIDKLINVLREPAKLDRDMFWLLHYLVDKQEKHKPVIGDTS